MELYVGYVPRVDPKTGEQIPERSLLWGDTHYAEEHTVLVASEQAAEDLGEGAAPVSLVKANIPIQYRINNLYHYTYNHDEPDELLEAICYRELTRLAASATVEVQVSGGDVSQDRENLFGAGRTRARQVLAERIQKAADDRGLGIELAFVGVQGIHPPPEVAPDYQRVIGAIQEKQALVLTAEAERNRTLSTLIGSVRRAHELADWARQYQEAREAGDADRIESLGQQLDQAFADARGEIFRILRQAQSYAFEKATLAEATGERFASQVKAYEAAPNIYVHEQRLAALEEALKGVRKYVVAADANDTQVTIINLEESATPNLMDIGGLSENSGL
jgi:regulator of protease activity HflC (stomatin/prohibitin superfamily)